MKNPFSQPSPLMLALLSGILLALSWPLHGVPVLIFVAFVPLLIAEEMALTDSRKYHSYTVFLISWLGFMVFNALTTWWIYFASFAGVLMAVLLNSLLMAIPFSLMHLVRRIFKGRSGAFSLVILWTTFEYLHMNWELSWSWLNLGNVFATMPNWVQWYEYTGTLGGTIWILLINVCFYYLIKTYTQKVPALIVERTLETEDEQQKKNVETYIKHAHQLQIFKLRFILGLVCFFLLCLPPVISWQVGKRFIMVDDPVEVVIVQPGRDPYLRPANLQQERQWTDQMIELAQRHANPQTRFVIAPEAALPSGLWLHSKSEHYGFNALAEHLHHYDSLTWITGVMMYRLYENQSEASATARPMRQGTQFYDVYNAALLIRTDGESDTYFKSRLVPGIERMPFARFLKPVGRLVEQFGGTASSMGVQEEPSVFAGMDGTLVAPVICYESIYGDYVNQYIKKGAQLIFILTNDGWWRDTPGYRQHNQYARLRAIETRRSIARAAKTGISSFIDPKGNFMQQTNWWEADAIVAQLHKDNRLTYYVRYGDYLGRMCLFLSLLLLAYIASQWVIRRKRMPGL